MTIVLASLPACTTDPRAVADYALTTVDGDLDGAELRAALEEELSMFLGAGEASFRAAHDTDWRGGTRQ